MAGGRRDWGLYDGIYIYIYIYIYMMDAMYQESACGRR